MIALLYIGVAALCVYVCVMGHLYCVCVWDVSSLSCY